MEENLESHVGSEDVCKLENINVNAKNHNNLGKEIKKKIILLVITVQQLGKVRWIFLLQLILNNQVRYPEFYLISLLLSLNYSNRLRF